MCSVCVEVDTHQKFKVKLHTDNQNKCILEYEIRQTALQQQ